MSELRKHIRYRTLAKAKIKGILEGESLLKDISVTGCRVECTSYAGIKPNMRYKIVILPEESAEIDMFELLVETTWIRSEGYSCDIGFLIVDSPGKKQFRRYVDYLAWRYAQGNSITGGNSPETPPEP